MKKEIKFLIGLLLCLLASTTNQAQEFPFNADRWVINDKEATIETFEGKQSLFLKKGKVFLKEMNFLNGIIEFNIFLPQERGFPGLLFRMEDSKNYEEIYFRTHLSGKPDAMQYTPVFNGNSAWQLYHDQGKLDFQTGEMTMETLGGYNTIYEWPYDRWFHVKVVVSGTQAAVYFDHEETPTLQIRELKRGLIAGTLGLKTARIPVHIANFSVTKMEKPPLKPVAMPTRAANPDVISNWLISSVFSSKELEDTYRLDADFTGKFHWTTLSAEPNGIANIAKVATRSRETNTVFAKVHIQSEKAQMKRLDFGYSDRARVYCNGQIIYSGNNNYLNRDYRYLGTIGLFDAVYLPLKKGDNELMIAVSETFGGWGIQAKIEDRKGIQIE